MLCKYYWIVLYTVHVTAFCLGGPFFFRTRCSCSKNCAKDACMRAPIGLQIKNCTMRQIICCRRPTHLEQLASWHSWSDAVHGNIHNTVENLPVCLTAPAPVFLNWRLRNVHYDMMIWYVYDKWYCSWLMSTTVLFLVYCITSSSASKNAKIMGAKIIS